MALRARHLLEDGYTTKSSHAGQIPSLIRGRMRPDISTSQIILRTKPGVFYCLIQGRRDAPPSISMSCSDKILLWNALGIQGAFLSRWLTPVFLSSMVISLPEESYFGIHRQEYESRCLWALNHRLSSLHNHKFHISMIPTTFSDSRESVEQRTHQECGVAKGDEYWPAHEPDPCAACTYQHI